MKFHPLPQFPNPQNIRFLFVHAHFMFQGPNSVFHDFVVACKGCRENIAARIETMPDDWIVETCPFCLETRRYLPQEIFRGRISYRYARLRVRREA
jgi:hypothetical protein